MKYTLQYTKSAKKDLEAINIYDARRIIIKLEVFINIKPMKQAKPLSGRLKGLFRFRIGVYRVVFSKDEHGKIVILNILRIKHRKDVYKGF